MNEQDQVLVAYILDSIEKIAGLLADYPDFRSRLFSDWIMHDAALHRLQTLAESAQRLSPSLKESLPEVPWKKISGFRNVLVHQYLGDIDPEVLWRVITHEMPLLREALEGYRPTIAPIPSSFL